MTESQIELTEAAIDGARVLDFVRTPQAGAAVLFLGTVREFTHGRQTDHLHYDAYRPMAESQLAALVEETIARWPVLKVAVAHRLGELQLGDVSVAVAVSTPHRADAFDAGRHLIDRLKAVVPIWKREHWSDGEVEWVHPQMPPPAA